ncbi:hypothetical protein NMG60_11006243 [Bertholletia excelsa]
MESVVATVTGFHGVERFKLIKLISHSGANYVGTLDRSTTHLVCWKFEGRKYDLAKQLKTLIVNHRWVEECIKQGRRVPEHPFLLHSGDEVGPLLLDVPIVAEKNLSSKSGKSKNFCELQEEAVKKIPLHCYSSSRCYEGSSIYRILGIAKEEPSFHSSVLMGREKRSTNLAEPCRQARRLVKRNIMESAPSDYDQEGDPTRENRSTMLKAIEKSTNLAEHCHRRRRLVKKNILQSALSDNEQESDPTGEEPSSSIMLLATKKRSTTTAEPRRRGRRLVKKNVLVSASADTEQHSPAIVNHQYIDLTIQSNHLDDTRGEKRLKIKGPSAESLHDAGANRNADFEDIDEVEDLNGPLSLRSSKSDARVAHATFERTSEDLCSNMKVNLEGTEHIARMPASTNVSCVICWTDFSSSRGVLPCGHRFCFTCIQNWADLTASRGKTSTCPLCKASFVSITKVDDTASLDQKIYSQTVPSDPSKVDVFILPEAEPPTFRPQPLPTPVVCTECCSREPEELLVKCNLCQVRCIHSYCLDPFLLPWTCTHCKDLQLLYHHIR